MASRWKLVTRLRFDAGQNWRSDRRNSLNLTCLIPVVTDGNATRVGHQNHGPRILRMHGTTNERTIRVSSNRPMHTMKPT